MGFVGAFVAGVVVWTWLEDMLHRWVFHRRVLGRIPSREHLKHHAKVDWFAPWSSKLALAVPALALLSGLGVLGAGAAGAGLPAGTFAGWLVYEWIHRRIHVTAPRNAYERWARAHHLSHHFGRSHANHGVSTSVWDHVFGTYEAPGVVTVPRLHAAKFPWLVEERDGRHAVREGYVTQYRVV